MLEIMREMVSAVALVEKKEILPFSASDLRHLPDCSVQKYITLTRNLHYLHIVLKGVEVTDGLWVVNEILKS